MRDQLEKQLTRFEELAWLLADPVLEYDALDSRPRGNDEEVTREIFWYVARRVRRGAAEIHWQASA
ncbi:MAG TPA: hypothetical protein VFE24_15685 [Pirellulales bacterium]|jgi:hypothetical protein|nr:hypothetical protein [Pirellulales bacterium]